MKNFSRESRSLYTINKMNSSKDFFDSYIWEEKEKFEVAFNSLTEDYNSSDVLISEKEHLLAEKNELLKTGYQLFLDGRGRARNRDKANTKLYFKDFDSKSTKNNLKNIYLALTYALVIIKNDDFNDLNIFKAEFEEIVGKIKVFMAEKENKLIDLLDAEAKTKSLEDNWDKEYQSLKYFVKAYCYKKDVDYRIYFEDLGNTTRSSNKNDESTEKKEIVEENPNNPE